MSNRSHNTILSSISYLHWSLAFTIENPCSRENDPLSFASSFERCHPTFPSSKPFLILFLGNISYNTTSMEFGFNDLILGTKIKCFSIAFGGIPCPFCGYWHLLLPAFAFSLLYQHILKHKDYLNKKILFLHLIASRIVWQCGHFINCVPSLVWCSWD